MTIGPAPMIRIDSMSVRLGMGVLLLLRGGKGALPIGGVGRPREV